MVKSVEDKGNKGGTDWDMEKVRDYYALISWITLASILTSVKRRRLRLWYSTDWCRREENQCAAFCGGKSVDN